jgi:hypothetical protein
MADLVPVAVSVRDASPVGMSRKIDLIAGVAITAGQAVYCNTSGYAALADASAAGTAVCLGIALETVSIGQSVPILMDGWLDGMAVSGVAYGVLLKLSDTAGAVDNGAGSPTVSAPIGRVLAATDGALTKLVLLNCSYNLSVLPA